MATDEEYLVGWTVELRLIRYRYRSPDPDLIPSQNIGLMSPINAPIWCFYIPLVLTTVVLVAEDVNAKSALWWDNWTDSYRYQIYQCGSNVRTYSRSCVSLSFTVSFWEPSLLSSAACLCFMAGVQADMEPGGRDTDVTPVGDKVGCYVALLHLFVFLETLKWDILPIHFQLAACLYKKPLPRNLPHFILRVCLSKRDDVH